MSVHHRNAAIKNADDRSIRSNDPEFDLETLSTGVAPICDFINEGTVVRVNAIPPGVGICEQRLAGTPPKALISFADISDPVLEKV
jgi:hypothetical protein